MFSKKWEKKYEWMLQQFQREQNLNLKLIGELEHLKLCNKCSSKLIKITSKYI